jgi:hypothetical protein
VPQGTNKFESIDDLVSALGATSYIPCSSVDGFYSTFRGGAYVDGGYCADMAETCPKTEDPTKCLKISSAFLGPNRHGTPYPTVKGAKKRERERERERGWGGGWRRFW